MGLDDQICFAQINKNGDMNDGILGSSGVLESFSNKLGPGKKLEDGIPNPHSMNGVKVTISPVSLKGRLYPRAGRH